MIVVDASVWVSILLATDLFHFQSLAWFQRYDRLNGEMTAPALLLPEVSAGLTRRTNDVLVGKSAINYLINLDRLQIVDVDHRLALAAANLAVEYQLRGADAVYAALAYVLNVPLLTWDQEQITRVQKVVRAGIPGTLFGSNGHGDSGSTPPNDPI